MNFSEYLACDATAMAQAVARGEVQPAQLLDLALAQQQRVHGRINAICRLMEAEARTRIAEPRDNGPAARLLGGVPFLIKDISHDYAGVPTTHGSRGLRDFVPREHSVVVRRLLEAGAVIFGKTNLPELALKAVTDARLFGPCSNPWDLARTPGGSSGGAAAAIAAGIVPMATANDGGGSIRIPAAYCGLFGLRPSRGRISAGPAQGQVWHGASSEGVISRSVRDTALALDVLCGHEPGEPYAVAAPAVGFVACLARPPRRLRIGLSSASPIGTPVEAEAVAAVEGAAALLRGLGHEVEEATPDIDGIDLAKSYLHMYFGVVAAMVGAARARGARAADFEPLTRMIETLGHCVSAGTLTRELEKWNRYARALAAFHRRYDLLLTPTVAGPAPLHGAGDLQPMELYALEILQRTGLLAALARRGLLDSTITRILAQNLKYVPFTQLANLTGTPAMSVPLHWTAAGLPLGVQFVAPVGDEATLLQLAHQLEQAQPWMHRLPAWVARAGTA